MKTITIKPHSILLFVGPSHCGKDYFIDNFLRPSISKQDPFFKFKCISSDDIRRDLLGDKSYHKHAPEMMYVSDQAFNILFNQLDNFTSYPSNNDVVLINSTGLSEEFRDQVREIAHKNNYNVHVFVFSYKDRAQHLQYVDANTNTFVIKKHLEKLKDTWKTFSKKKYSDVTHISTNNFSEFEIQIENIDLYKDCFLPKSNREFIIGDIHGCLKEFKELLIKLGFTIDSNDILDCKDNIPPFSVPHRLILVGDYIDKGYDILGTIRFIYNNRNWFDICVGNHENYVYKALKNEIDRAKEVEEEFFGTIKLLEENPQEKEMFFELFESSKPFISTPDFIVTHAPCEKKYLGKIDSNSQKKQRNIRYARKKDFSNSGDWNKAVEKELEFLVKESSNKYGKRHFFGHLACTGFTHKNKICLDTGCASGGKLTAIETDGKYIKWISVDAKENSLIKREELLDIFKPKAPEIDLKSLDIKETKRIGFIAHNKINFISGTMCPADKDVEKGILESLEKGLNYYKEKGITKVMLQPKWMGSRLNIALHKNIEESYSVSRNGYKVHREELQEDLKKIYGRLHERKQIKDLFSSGVKIIYLDGEICPWSFLGEGLIERDFQGVNEGIRSEIEFMTNNNFDASVLAFEKICTDNNYKEIINSSSKKDLIEKLGHSSYSSIKNFLDYFKKHYSVSDHKKAHETYNKQLELYGKKGEAYYMPFAILKIVYDDDSEKLFFDGTNEEIYKTITDMPYTMVDLNDKNYVSIANIFFNMITLDNQMEGIVIKPEKVYNKGIAPYIKVRNSDYLHIIMGYDYLFPTKYEKLLRRKGINTKLRTSINEFELGKKMLETPYKDITPENMEYRQLAAQMVLEERKEKEIDPRL